MQKLINVHNSWRAALERTRLLQKHFLQIELLSAGFPPWARMKDHIRYEVITSNAFIIHDPKEGKAPGHN